MKCGSSLAIRTCIKVQVHPKKLTLAKKATPAAYFDQIFDHHLTPLVL